MKTAFFIIFTCYILAFNIRLIYLFMKCNSRIKSIFFVPNEAVYDKSDLKKVGEHYEVKRKYGKFKRPMRGL